MRMNETWTRPRRARSQRLLRFNPEPSHLNEVVKKKRRRGRTRPTVVGVHARARGGGGRAGPRRADSRDPTSPVPTRRIASPNPNRQSGSHPNHLAKPNLNLKPVFTQR